MEARSRLPFIKPRPLIETYLRPEVDEAGFSLLENTWFISPQSRKYTTVPRSFTSDHKLCLNTVSRWIIAWLVYCIFGLSSSLLYTVTQIVNTILSDWFVVPLSVWCFWNTLSFLSWRYQALVAAMKTSQTPWWLWSWYRNYKTCPRRPFAENILQFTNTRFANWGWVYPRHHLPIVFAYQALYTLKIQHTRIGSWLSKFLCV